MQTMVLEVARDSTATPTVCVCKAMLVCAVEHVWTHTVEQRGRTHWWAGERLLFLYQDQKLSGNHIENVSSRSNLLSFLWWFETQSIRIPYIQTHCRNVGILIRFAQILAAESYSGQTHGSQRCIGCLLGHDDFHRDRADFFSSLVKTNKSFHPSHQEAKGFYVRHGRRLARLCHSFTTVWTWFWD